MSASPLGTAAPRASPRPETAGLLIMPVIPLIPTILPNVAPPPVGIDGAGKAAAHSMGEGHADHGGNARGGPGGMGKKREWDGSATPTANLSDEAPGQTALWPRRC